LNTRKFKKAEAQRVEIVRSFSYKLNVGQYESRDFFCSQKAQCDAGDAARTSAALYQFCKTQVLASVREYQAEAAAAFGPRRVNG
jgi:hypothetical protein